jgi:putative ABC transport system ATP-binding protein
LIKITDLTKSFGGRILFSNFNLEIATGEFVVLTGPSGCGKTTLLNMIGALEPFEWGEIVVDGINISKKRNLLNYYRNKVGFLFQNFALIENKTVLENLQMVKTEFRSGVKIKDALLELGIMDTYGSKVYTLSGGEQQRVALARLMIKRCDIILADEPTGSLDKDNSEIIINNLVKLNEAGKTVVLVTHNEEYKKIGRTVEIAR